MTSKNADRKTFVKKFVNREKKTLGNQIFINKSILFVANSIDNSTKSKSQY